MLKVTEHSLADQAKRDGHVAEYREMAARAESDQVGA